MTKDEYRTLVSTIRYYYNIIVSGNVDRKKLGLKPAPELDENRARLIALYLELFDNYFLPAKVIGVSSIGGTSITMSSTIASAQYSDFVGHSIVAEDVIDTIAVARKFTASEILLVGSTSAASENAEFIIGENHLTMEEMRAVLHDINKLLGTNFGMDYFSEFDTTLYEEIVVRSRHPLLWGSNTAILTGETIYAGLNVDADFAGSTTEKTFTFSLKYPYFAYPATYPALASIKDQENDDVLASGAFDQYLLDVEIPGVDGTRQYRVYRTDYLTAIPGNTYTFNF